MTFLFSFQFPFIFAAQSTQRLQAPTHILAGVILNKMFQWKNYRFFAYFLLFLSAILSHAILDKLAVATYHPPHAAINDPFWLGYHIAVFLSSLFLLYLFWGDYKYGILFALLPDLDWLIIHGAGLFGKEVSFYHQPYFHQALNWFMDSVPPFSFLNLLPDNRLQYWACGWELLLVAVLIFFYRALVRRRRNIHFGS